MTKENLSIILAGFTNLARLEGGKQDVVTSVCETIPEVRLL